MRKILVLIFLIAMITIVGCQKNIDVDNKEKETTINVESKDGNAEITVKEGDVDSWCATGTEWKSTGTQGNAQMIVQGIIKTGKYAGYCHVTYDVDAEGTQADINYYFNEEGDGYQVMVVNGQTFESEWTTEE